MVNDELSLIISDYYDFHKKPSKKQSIALGAPAGRASAPATRAFPLLRLPLIRLKIILRENRGSWGYTPHAASPSGGERGSLS